jgi:hypothetical protein
VLRSVKKYHYRTLVNKLIATVFWCFLVWNLVAQTGLCLFYLAFPLKSNIAYRIIYSVFCVSSLHILNLHNAIIITCSCSTWKIRQYFKMIFGLYSLTIGFLAWIQWLNYATLFARQRVGRKNSLGHTWYSAKNELGSCVCKHFMYHFALGFLIHKFIFQRSQKYLDFKKFEVSLHTERIFHCSSHLPGSLLIVSGLFYFPQMYNSMHPQVLDRNLNNVWLFSQDHNVNPCCMILTLAIFIVKMIGLRGKCYKLCQLFSTSPQNHQFSL